jgi:hypothetical protein
MSDTVRQVIERAINEEQFRALLFQKPDEALQGYELSDDERARLSALNQDNFDDFAGPLAGRTTKGTWVPPMG